MKRRTFETNLIGRRCSIQKWYLDHSKSGTLEGAEWVYGEVVTAMPYPDGSGVRVGLLMDTTGMITDVPTSVLHFDDQPEIQPGGTD
jgi:hypothetical protein